MELRPHPKDSCSPVGSFFMHCYVECLLFLEYCGDQLKRSFDETSFVNRYINLIVC